MKKIIDIISLTTCLGLLEHFKAFDSLPSIYKLYRAVFYNEKLYEHNPLTNVFYDKFGHKLPLGGNNNDVPLDGKIGTTLHMDNQPESPTSGTTPPMENQPEAGPSGVRLSTPEAEAIAKSILDFRGETLRAHQAATDLPEAVRILEKEPEDRTESEINLLNAVKNSDHKAFCRETDEETKKAIQEVAVCDRAIYVQQNSTDKGNMQRDLLIAAGRGELAGDPLERPATPPAGYEYIREFADSSDDSDAIPPAEYSSSDESDAIPPAEQNKRSREDSEDDSSTNETRPIKRGRNK